MSQRQRDRMCNATEVPIPMWMRADDEGRQGYACKTCRRTKVFVFKEPTARKTGVPGNRMRITVVCPYCKGKTKRVGWLSGGSGLRRKIRRLGRKSKR